MALDIVGRQELRKGLPAIIGTYEKAVLAKIDLPPPGMKLEKDPKLEGGIEHKRDARMPNAAEH